MLKIIDTHTHTQFAAYDADREAVMARCAEAGVGQIVIGTQQTTSQKAIEMAHEYPNTWATVGLHPIHTDKSFHDIQELGIIGDPISANEPEVGPPISGFMSRGEVFDYEYYKKLAQDERVVAIGECGFDFFHLEEDSIKKQSAAFEAQIALANEVGKPLMIHTRPSGSGAKGTLDMKAYEMAYELVKSLAKTHCHMHFYVGNWDMAQKFLKLGCTVSFNGVITFAHSYDEVIKKMPLDMITLETDAPYLAPIPHRGKRNESTWVGQVARRIAEIKEIGVDEVAAVTLANAQRVFRLQKS